MMITSTTDIAAHLTDDLDINPSVAASVVDALLGEDEDEWL